VIKREVDGAISTIENGWVPVAQLTERAVQCFTQAVADENATKH
jgi:hypothetical protein